jgi:hypothetical protein
MAACDPLLAYLITRQTQPGSCASASGKFRVTIFSAGESKTAPAGEKGTPNMTAAVSFLECGQIYSGEQTIQINQTI